MDELIVPITKVFFSGHSYVSCQISLLGNTCEANIVQNYNRLAKRMEIIFTLK